MDEAKLHLNRLFYITSNLEHISANGPLVSSLILSSEVYFSSASTSTIMAFFRYSCSYNSPKPNFYFLLLTSGASSSPLIGPTSVSVRGVTLSQSSPNTQSLIIFSMVDVCSWVIMGLALDYDSNLDVDWSKQLEGISFPTAPTFIY